MQRTVVKCPKCGMDCYREVHEPPNPRIEYKCNHCDFKKTQAIFD